MTQVVSHRSNPVVTNMTLVDLVALVKVLHPAVGSLVERAAMWRRVMTMDSNDGNSDKGKADGHDNARDEGNGDGGAGDQGVGLGARQHLPAPHPDYLLKYNSY